MNIQKKIKWSTEIWTCSDCNLEWPEDVDNCLCGATWGKEWRYGLMECILPAKYEVCGCCSGTGKTFMGYTDSEQPVFTQEDLSEDPDFAEDMFSGRYDSDCPDCNGKRVIAQVEERGLKGRDLLIWEAFSSWCEAESDYAFLCAWERRMGC